jgi:preprotein translocase subunit SecY
MATPPAPRNPFSDPESLRRILFTIGALAVLRVGAFIPLPGVDAPALAALLGAGSGPLSVLDAFSGGALGRFALFSLGAIPLVNATVLAALLRLGTGKSGRAEAARRLTAPLALLQALAVAYALARTTGPGGAPLVAHPGAAFYLTTAAGLTAGAVFVLWLCEEISESGIGGGAVLAVMTGLLAHALTGTGVFFRLAFREELGAFSALFVIAALLLAVFAVCRVETARRDLTVNYSQRIVGRRMYGGSSTVLPVKLDSAGAVAAISAAAVGSSTLLLRGGWLDDLILGVLIVFFCVFSGAKSLDADDVSAQMKKTGGSIPGVRPGEATARHLARLQDRLALGGALLFAALAILPDLLRRLLRLPFFFDGVEVAIVVAAALDAMTRVESAAIMRAYAKFRK